MHLQGNQLRAGGRWLAAAAVVCAICLSDMATSRADNIDRELTRQAPKVMKYLRDEGYHNVGVLTFRVQRDGKKPSLRGSLMNNNMADRMENALVLAIDPEKPVQVIGDARNTAGRQLKNASYRTPADRKRLFDVKYQIPLEVQNRYAPADAFVTGKVAVSNDYRNTTVTIETFDKKRPKVFTKVHEFDVKTDRYVLADLGQGFSLSRKGMRFMRSVNDEDDIIEGIYEDVQANLDADTPSEIVYPEVFPVAVTVRYDGQEQFLEPDGTMGPNNWTVDDPKEGQEVVFDIENTTSEKLGMVITINGISTLYEEQGQPDQMTRWILAPYGKYRIKGFHNNDRETYKPIIGLPEDVSESLFEDLGGPSIAGLVHVYVFRQQDQALAGLPSVTRGSLRDVPPQQLNRRKPRSWSELQRHISGTMAMKSGRGLMAAVPESRDEQLKVDELPEVNLTDVMIIRYYLPEGANQGLLSE